MLGIDDPQEAGKSSCTKVQLGNQHGVEANVYIYGSGGPQIDIDVTKCQNLTGRSVIIGLRGVRVEPEFLNPSILKVVTYNDTIIEVRVKINNKNKLDQQ